MKGIELVESSGFPTLFSYLHQVGASPFFTHFIVHEAVIDQIMFKIHGETRKRSHNNIRSYGKQNIEVRITQKWGKKEEIL